MIYAHLIIKDADGFTAESKLVAADAAAYEDYKKYTTDELGYIIIDEFVDDDMGTIVILPEDFKY
ncbi:hypothetical protein [Hymenobacter terricola]|uniref:hypothetical protein n=1 Tax=Hymenobacter terricola TaxID=2819236 RepID=UPI001B3169FE|nr:hypothetical protein [Hymenobacter terricola]